MAKIIINTINSKIEGPEVNHDLLAELGDRLDVPIDNYQYSRQYQHQHIIPKHHFIDDKTQLFPTGLLEDVEDFLRERSIPFKTVDKRPKPIYDDNDISMEPIKATGKDGTQFNLGGKYQYQTDAINAFIENNHKGILYLSMGSGKTLICSILIKKALKHLQKGERILVFESTKSIYNQMIAALNNILYEECPNGVGTFQGGKFKDGKVVVIMQQSAWAWYKIDLKTGLKLTPKEAQYRKIVEMVAPKVEQSNDLLLGLKSYLRFTIATTKVDEKLLERISDDTKDFTKSSDVKKYFKTIEQKWQDILTKKNGSRVKKKTFMTQLLDSSVFTVVDELQHLRAQTYFNTIKGCHNSLLMLGLSGTLDEKDELLQRSTKALFGSILSSATIDDQVKRGVSTRPIIHMLNVEQPHDRELKYSSDWFAVRDGLIVHNEYRNQLVVDIVKKFTIPTKRVTMIVVSQIEHGEIIQNMLKEQGITAPFVHGSTDTETRNGIIDALRKSEQHIVITTSVLTEGVDIKSIKLMIICSAGKSFRALLQTVGRAIRLGGFNDAHIFDFNDKTSRILWNQSIARREIYQDQHFEIRFDQ